MTKVTLKQGKKGFVVMRNAKTKAIIALFNNRLDDTATRIIKLCRAQKFKLVEAA